MGRHPSRAGSQLSGLWRPQSLHQLTRDGWIATCCTIEHLMHDIRQCGVRRCKAKRTTITSVNEAHLLDLAWCLFVAARYGYIEIVEALIVVGAQ